MLEYVYLTQPGMLRVRIKCVLCGAIKTIDVPENGFFAWYKRGVSIQHALRNVPADDREMLMSQICSKCFDEVFADDE